MPVLKLPVGEAGRGFAVVVAKKLGDWQLSQPATKEIEQVVENIQRENKL